jgi:hypothetical protein
VRLHWVDGNAMGGQFSRDVTCLTGNQQVRQVARAVLAGEEERVKTFWVLVLDGRETGGTGETSESIVSGMSQRKKSVRLHQALRTQHSELLCPSRV